MRRSTLVDEVVVGAPFAIFPAGQDDFFPMLAFEGGVIPYERFRYPVVDGRFPDRAEPLEVALGERVSAALGKRTGDTIDMASFTPEGAQAVFGDGEDRPPDGPNLVLEVVGIVRDPGDLAGRDDDLTFTMLTPAFADRYQGRIGDIGDYTFVDLSDGATEGDLSRSSKPPSGRTSSSTRCSTERRSAHRPIRRSER